MMITRMYFNIICEEITVFGGKIIHIDENVSDIDVVNKIVKENYEKYPNGKWEMYIMGVSIPKREEAV